jgi:hypothetical protein
VLVAAVPLGRVGLRTHIHPSILHAYTYTHIPLHLHLVGGEAGHDLLQWRGAGQGGEGDGEGSVVAVGEEDLPCPSQAHALPPVAREAPHEAAHLLPFAGAGRAVCQQLPEEAGAVAGGDEAGWFVYLYVCVSICGSVWGGCVGVGVGMCKYKYICVCEREKSIYISIYRERDTHTHICI